jgi:hypothetical protein
MPMRQTARRPIMPMSRSRRPAAVLALVAGLCGGCDVVSEPPVAACAEIGSQCQLPRGPLGVCQQTECDAAAMPPCFKCTSQH